MPDIVFADKSAPPTPEAVAKALGKTHRFWTEIVGHALAQCPSATTEWKYPGAKWGWSFRVKDKKRNLIYMTPLAGFFRVAFAFGDRAVEAVEQSDLPEPIKAELRSATRYVEGRGLRLEVRTAANVRHARTLVGIKAAN